MLNGWLLEKMGINVDEKTKMRDRSRDHKFIILLPREFSKGTTGTLGIPRESQKGTIGTLRLPEGSQKVNNMDPTSHRSKSTQVTPN